MWFGGRDVCAADGTETERQLRELQQQNQALQAQLREQQRLIESLSQKVNEIQQATARRQGELESRPSDADADAPRAQNGSAFSLGRVNLSGEGGVAFFNSGKEGMTPHSEFRIDEARLFLETPIWNNVYFFGELDLATREEPDLNLRVGELYLDVENVSQLWGQERLLNLRLGRMYIPFGEEYLSRYAIDNALISHSLSDLWGVDEGLELYGRWGKLSYAVAAQNGGIPDTRDFDADKSVAGRIGFDPAPGLHLSLSGMRTGDLNVHNDHLSAMWFGNGFFRSLGSAQTTRFHASLAEADVAVQLPHGHLNLFGGYIRYGDNDPLANNGRDAFYYSVEGAHDLVGKLYGAIRFSQIFAEKGMPIAGNGQFEDYFFETLTKELWRLSLGVGYRWSQNFLVKAEYSFERGKELDGEHRSHEDLMALEAAFKF